MDLNSFGIFLLLKKGHLETVFTAWDLATFAQSPDQRRSNVFGRQAGFIYANYEPKNLRLVFCS